MRGLCWIEQGVQIWYWVLLVMGKKCINEHSKKKKTLRSVSETCTCLVRIHVLVCPFLSDPWIFVLCSLEMHMIASSLLGLAWGMSSSGTVSVRMERGRDASVRAQRVGCLRSRVPPGLGRSWLLPGAEGQHHVDSFAAAAGAWGENSFLRLLSKLVPCRRAGLEQRPSDPLDPLHWPQGIREQPRRERRARGAAGLGRDVWLQCTGPLVTDPHTEHTGATSRTRAQQAGHLPVQMHSWLPERGPNLSPQTAGPLAAHQVPHGIVHSQRRFMPHGRACPLFILCQKHKSLS